MSKIMSADIVEVEPNTQISHACYLMYFYGFRRFPVLDRMDRLIGIITERELLKAIKADYDRRTGA
ncbi:MAG: CBS domain-containing protein [Candidatus Altiarchaeota archaeon]